MKSILRGFPGLVVLVAGVLVSACTATLETKMQTLLHHLRVNPPLEGRNRVHIELQDQTGQGPEFEESVYATICEKIQLKGYEVVNADEADYVVWATLRIFDKVAKEDGNALLAGLGGIAGGVATDAALDQLTDISIAACGAAGGGLIGTSGERSKAEDNWAMVLDLQLGRRLTEATKQTIKVEDQSRILRATINSARKSAGAHLVSRAVEETVFLELEQRILAQAFTLGMGREDVAEALIDRISFGLSSQLPRYRRVGPDPNQAGDKPPHGGGDDPGDKPPQGGGEPPKKDD